MSPIIIFAAISVYFLILVLISRFTAGNDSNSTFFTANRRSPWYLVAFGMIGATLSGVTFISVPGDVGNTAFTYLQMVVGYLAGYVVIATVLLPLYYRLGLTSIYGYLEQRYGVFSYKTGSFFFMLSQVVGASARLFLVAGVLQLGFFDAFHIPFAATVAVTILLIWTYTFRGGIKTIVWTDTLQTFFMLLAVVLSIVIIVRSLGLSFGEAVQQVYQHPYTRVFDFDWSSGHFFVKHFFAGMFITIVMNGLDQNMMQKNMTCKTLADSQKNVYTFSLVLLPVHLLFMSMGVLLYIYVEQHGITFTDLSSFHLSPTDGKYLRTDDLFPQLALHHFPLVAGLVFFLGIIAAAFSSADSSLTALTTTFCVDMLGYNSTSDTAANRRTRRLVHLSFSVILFAVILLFRHINERSIIQAVLVYAGYTYGPLLGLFSFGLATKRLVRDRWVPLVAVLAPILTFVLSRNSAAWFWGYKFGFEIIIVNGLLMFAALFAISRRA